MRLVSLFAVASLFVISSADALAQAPQSPVNAPTTVQLPTFSFFTVQTTVSVPDSGAGFLGGLGRAGDGSTTRGAGPLRNRALGSTRGASNMSVHARIIDNHEMDQAVLAEAAAKRGGDAAGRVTAAVEQASKRGSFESVAAIREQHAKATALKSREAAEFLSKAQQAETDGKTGLAKIYYQMVIRRDSGSLKEQAQSRLAAIASGKGAAVATR